MPSRDSARRAPPSSAARLRGPVNHPVLISSFAEFQHMFGGLWQPSPLGYAVEQYFDNGGREALIVRIVNGARAATLTLNAGMGALTLGAVRPGTREFLRVSVDYDNVRDRIMNSISRCSACAPRARHRLKTRRYFRNCRCSLLPRGYLPLAIVESALMRLAGELPAQRPDRTVDAVSGLATGYVNSNSDGDDGAPLTDYDLIGSARRAHRLVRARGRATISISCASRPCRAIKTWGRARCWWARATARSGARC